MIILNKKEIKFISLYFFSGVFINFYVICLNLLDVNCDILFYFNLRFLNKLILNIFMDSVW